MGDIIFWALIRTVVLVPTLWYLLSFFKYENWILWSAFAIYLVVIHPAITQYQKFVRQNREVVSDTLCASCKHFDESAVLCMKHDKHPTKEYIPCDGIHWEIS